LWALTGPLFLASLKNRIIKDKLREVRFRLFAWVTLPKGLRFTRKIPPLYFFAPMGPTGCIHLHRFNKSRLVMWSVDIHVATCSCRNRTLFVIAPK
jgi:hypothetical protein